MAAIYQVLDYIQNHRMINSGDLVVVAVSGGADSVSLLHILYTLQEKLNISLYAAHLDHMFRGKESQEDAEFVKSLCEKWGISYSIEQRNVPEYQKRYKLSGQVAAREVRYKFLDEVADKINADRIALAHHADDQAETVLLNLLRGSGPSGLAGIIPVRDDRYIRPLLGLRRKEIEQYCRENNLKYRIDSSNKKTIYLRNKVRLQLMNVLEENYNPEIVSALGRLAELCRVEDDYIKKQVSDIWPSLVNEYNGERIELNLAEFNRLHLALQRRIIRQAWMKLTGGQKGLSYYHVESAVKMCRNTNLGIAELPNGYRCRVSYSKIYIEPQESETSVPPYCCQLQIPGKTIVKEIKKVITAKIIPAREFSGDPSGLPSNEAVLDYDKTGINLFARKRCPGDTFAPQGAGGKVKLKKFFIDQKVPREIRDYTPLVCSCEDIIWVSGLRVGEYWKVTENTKKILHLKVEDLD